MNHFFNYLKNDVSVIVNMPQYITNMIIIDTVNVLYFSDINRIEKSHFKWFSALFMLRVSAHSHFNKPDETFICIEYFNR